MKNLKLSYLVLALALVVFGCNEPNSEKIFELSFLELDAATTASGSRTYTYLRENNGVNKASGFKVNLASQPLSQDVQVSFEVLSSSTAIQNVHYAIANQVVVIPAGENIAELPIEIIADGIEAGEQLTINIKITGDANVPAMTGLDEASHIIQISCESSIPEGDWTAPDAGTTTLTKTGDLTYQFSNFNYGYYNPVNNPIEGQFEDICGNLTLFGESRFGVQWRGKGVYDPAANTITFADGVEDITFNPGIFGPALVFTK